ncbi:MULTISPECIES: 4Fe-4S dicluster domain-containing protein [Gordonibacter]|uniref:Carboxypeptidase regulatory-like domain-containing protein n=1 Tax=Gordonibacter faecis TaxID=3047475 RepID=A0ABT7DP11_9ACTN|nr:4Fe-4S dicluster domain-containing protein [Gordonibacter sp. KGMB12511]MDJ1651274.1 carboxypeptidase regulatory-like domain-containing protein [Gordonibacter sp. KGMB12511]
MGKAFIIDVTKCSGCRNCQIACKDEHVDNDWSPWAKPQPDTGQFWTRVDEQVRGQVPKVRISYTVHMCQHCENAPCMAAAPEAVYRRDDGLVIVDPEKAADKRELVEACPYGAIFWNEELAIPQKCTGCAHLVDAGEVPHCVDVCPHGALRFGEEEEFAEEIAVAEALLPERAATDKPHVYYLNLPKRFLAGMVVDLEADEVIIGAKVTAENLDSGEVLASETDEFGDFWFHQVAAANWRVYVEAEGYLTRMLEASTVDEDRNMGPIELFAAE